MDKVAIVVLAGGVSSRLQSETPKQFLRISGQPVLVHTVLAFRAALPHARIVVGCAPEYHQLVSGMFAGDNLVNITNAGSCRQETCFQALRFLEREMPDIVLVHDASRPFVSQSTIVDVVEALREFSAVNVAIPASDTIILERDGFVASVPDRRFAYRGQTPQGFRFEKLLTAYKKVGVGNFKRFTDDCGIFQECYPTDPIKIVIGSPDNIKLTFPVDMVLAEELFRLRTADVSRAVAPINVAGKRALVFGGTRGIGRAIVDVLNDGDCRTIAVSRSTGCDVGSAEDVRNAVEHARSALDGLDFVVNTAGLLYKKRLVNQPNEEVEQTIRTNIVGAINISKQSFYELRKSKGMLLHIASSAYSRGRAEYAPYSASKAAVVNLTQGLAEEWGADGVRVNCLIPGRTRTAMRVASFGRENPSDLNNAYSVALDACKVLTSDITGTISRC